MTWTEFRILNLYDVSKLKILCKILLLHWKKIYAQNTYCKVLQKTDERIYILLEILNFPYNKNLLQHICEQKK